MNNYTLSIYLELTDIVDTRLNSLDLMGIDINSTDMLNWSNRKTDDVLGVSSELLYYRHKHKLNKDYLSMPRPTKIFNFINRLVDRWSQNNIDLVTDLKIKVYVNIHDCELTTLEKTYIEDNVRTAIISSDVELVDFDEPSFNWVRDNVTVFVSYYGMKWFNNAMVKVDRGTRYMPHVTLVVPNTLETELPKDHTAEEVDYVVRTYEGVINLLPAPLEVFSFTGDRK